MKKLLPLLFVASLTIPWSCQKETLPPADAVYVKFVNRTGSEITGLIVNRLEVGDIPKGKTAADYHRFEALGQQYGYALVEAVADIAGKKHYASQACQGVCGTPSAPDGEWLAFGNYKIAIRLAPPGEYIEFVVEE